MHNSFARLLVKANPNKKYTLIQHEARVIVLIVLNIKY